jgi:hypothetical protein
VPVFFGGSVSLGYTELEMRYGGDGGPGCLLGCSTCQCICPLVAGGAGMSFDL